MFPMELAAGPMSLLAGVDRPALSIGLHICPTHGNITKGTCPHPTSLRPCTCPSLDLPLGSEQALGIPSPWPHPPSRHLTPFFVFCVQWR
jgi:hypothetical protein